jgi:hypothetical protein
MSASPRTNEAGVQPRSEEQKGVEPGSPGALLFRAVNENVRSLADGSPQEELEVVCECEHRDCAERIVISAAAYDTVRRFPTRFLIKPEHVSRDDRIVEQGASYAVVEKIGPGAEAAILRDPRRERGAVGVSPAEAGALRRSGPAEVAANQPRLLFFLSATSGACRRAEGFLAQVLQRRGNHSTFRVLSIDADSRPDLVEKFGIDVVPTLLVVADGRVRARLTEPKGCAQISRVLEPWLR